MARKGAKVGKPFGAALREIGALFRTCGKVIVALAARETPEEQSP